MWLRCALLICIHGILLLKQTHTLIYIYKHGSKNEDKNGFGERKDKG